jgi:serine/threonine-protein kinase
VAIKTIGCAGLSAEEKKTFEERFYCEAKSAGRLNHPNIVTIHDAGRTDDLAYIAMEYLNGRTLQEILDAGVALPVERCAEIAARIADGLAFAHANGVVHRDIKPANIMVFDSGAIKIADFGVALIPTGSQTVDGMTYGSPKYMSPEQINGRRVDGRSDIFSLGAVLYEMLVGRPPFNGDNLNAILFQVLNNAPPLPSSFNPAIPHGIDRIVARALAKDPEKRYQNASQMAADLRKWRHIVKSAQKAHAANDPTPASGAGKNVHRHKARANTWSPLIRFGLPVLLAVGLGAWALLHSESADEPPPAVPTVTASAPAAPPASPVESAANLPAREEPTPPVVATPPEVTPAPATEAPAPTEANPPPPAEARIRLAIAPWGEVWADGRMVGVSPPLNELRLPPGKHRIEIRNAGFAPYRRTVEVAPDANLRIKHKFE